MVAGVNLAEVEPLRCGLVEDGELMAQRENLQFKLGPSGNAGTTVGRTAIKVARVVIDIAARGRSPQAAARTEFLVGTGLAGHAGVTTITAETRWRLKPKKAALGQIESTKVIHPP